MNLNLGQPVKNRHKVQVKQWRKWNNHAKKMFNATYAELKNQQTVLSPETLLMTRQQWDVLRWNVAWTVAGIANGK